MPLEQWAPIHQWIYSCHEIDPSHQPPYLFIDDEAQNPIAALNRRCDHTAPDRPQLRIRLPIAELPPLIAQLRFWDAAFDEIPRRFRECLPTGCDFASAAFCIEDAHDEAIAPKRARLRPPLCADCGKPVGPSGQAEVNIDGTAIFRHHRC